MLAISTAYWPFLEDGQKILDEVDRLGFSAIEVSSYTGRKALDEMLPTLRRMRVKTLSLHNPCPKFEPRLLPWETERLEPLVTAKDPEERRAAVDLACTTIELAANLEAKAVVVHLGTTEMPSPTEALREMFDREEVETDEGRERVATILEERARAGEEVWDRLSFSLEALTRKAEHLDVFLGIENRIHLSEIPTYEELGRILVEFEGGNFRYWHDIGHATVHQNLGLIDIEEALTELGGHLLGLHIHDAKGYDDHIAPGKGDSNFAVVTPYLTSETPRVIEIHPQASEEELLEGLKVLRDSGILAPTD